MNASKGSRQARQRQSDLQAVEPNSLIASVRFLTPAFSAQLARAHPILEQHAPAPNPRVSLAGAIGIGLNRLAHWILTDSRAAIGSSLATSPYDVSRGGFSGGNFNLTTQSGTNFKVRTSSLNLDAPQMQWTDAAARALGQQYSNVSLGGRTSGPLMYNAAFYNIAYQLGRRQNDLQTLLNTSPLGLQTSGIAQDSVTRLRGIAQALGIPVLSLEGFPL